MTGRALKEAFQAWIRHPREMALANAAAFVAIFLPALALAAAQGLSQGPAFAAMALWAWMVFSALCALCSQLSQGTLSPWSGTLEWLKRSWKERLAAFAVAAAGACWLGLVIGFYLNQGLPAWLTWGATGLLGAFGTWLALAQLLGFGVAAEGGRPLKAAWKAAALLPLAYAPAALAAAGIFLLAVGFPVLFIGLKHWSARLWMAPLLMSPFFTLAFLAAYVTALVQALFEHAQGHPAPETAPWRELWTPWR